MANGDFGWSNIGQAFQDWGARAGQSMAGTGQFGQPAGATPVNAQGLPGVVQDLKPITDLIGQGYSLYMSYEIQKQAAKAAQKYGGQVAIPYPVGTVGGPSPSGGFQTIVDVKAAELAPTPKPSIVDTKTIVTVGAVAGIGYMLLR